MSKPQPVRYYEWNQVTGIVSQFERHGECNGCGQCCSVAIHYYGSVEGQASAPKKFNHGKNRNFSKISDGGLAGPILYEVRQGKHRRLMTPVTLGEPDVCRELGENKKCALHKFKNWKRRIIELCDVWPIHPDQVKVFDQCSYSFEKVKEWKIKDLK